MISVVIPTRNRKDMLKECVFSVFEQIPAGIDCEIIIVDDESVDGTSEIVSSMRSSFSNIKYIRQQRHKGCASARNLGIRRSSFELIAFVDDDCVVEEKWMLNMLKAFQDYPEELAFQGGTINIKSPNWLQRAYKRLVDIYGQKLIRHDCNVDRVYTDVLGNNFFTRKELFRKYGLFDPFYDFAAEDMDFWSRLKEKGQNILYIPQVTARHRYKASLPGFCRQQINYGRGLWRFHERWGKKMPLKQCKRRHILIEILKEKESFIILPIHLAAGALIRLGCFIERILNPII